MSIGKSVRLFLADGTPGGLLTAEIMNWTGHVVAAPRSDLGALLKRPEASRTGIYILLGDDPDSMGGSLAYIGEGDDVSRRLYQHSRPEEQGGKDFWERAIILTSKDANLTKAHARYLESRLITLAQQANRARLTNGTAPVPLPLPEADISDMEYFIAQVKIALPVLGVNLFRNTTVTTASSNAADPLPPVQSLVSPLFEMRLARHGIVATAQEVDGEFTVLKASLARASWVGVEDGYGRLRDKLVQDGTLVPTQDGKLAVFARDQVFASPSAASAIVSGRNSNGRMEWKVQSTGLTYGAWQNQEIELTRGAK
ncbi:GIY-YIG nuclease family protein [Arthrobacter gengyunqii]|uniref:GIY-YIG nuclease family protein n=1 Tax=Arthrobacter gengyunqii TaxID=2886940 RepID=A0A9X1M2M3_9MICC|nr:GIY-YIG nuclease family protein [Arthrobacter gengyunqii]MCC3270096.1 GIY-YIG nuclease family protein [Arthrobacter gengyunqii]UOY96804.1 GIY-YIG nuclease family protein [Arthrobacter gengyunqii]